MRDVLIAGGGPVGLVTALYARRAGLSALVVEPRPAPIDKACGEGLMPGAVAVLQELSIERPGRPFRGIAYVNGRTSAVADFRRGTGLGVRRTELHARLWDAAERAGVELAEGRVEELGPDGDGVRAGPYRARYLVGADGLHSTVGRLTGLTGPPPRHRRWGQRAHFAVTPWTDRVEVHWSDVGEAYVTPVGPDCVGVAVLTEQRAPFARLLESFPALRDRLPAAPVAAARAAGPLRRPVSGRVAGPVLLVGDAAGYVDALTGEGLAMGFACARALVERLAGGQAAAYEGDYRRITRRYRLLTGALVTATRSSPVRRAIVPTARRLPGVFAATVHQLAGEAAPGRP